MKKHSPKTKQTPCRVTTDQVVEQFRGGVQTRYGGAGLWRRFLSKLHMYRLLCEVRVPWHGRCFGTADYLFGMLAALLLGEQRQSAVAQLGEDPGALRALQLEDMPSQSALSRFLGACTRKVAGQLLELNGELVRRIRGKCLCATIDMDGQVVTTRGNPEGANYGYNPKRRGSKSYFLMMSFWGELRDILGAWMYPGNKATISTRAAIRTYERARKTLPAGVRRVRLRADAAFFSEGFACYLEREDVTYCIPLRVGDGVKPMLPGLPYRPLDDNYAIADTPYQAPGWKQPRRLVVVRQRLAPENPEKKAQALKLFQCDGYAFTVHVTNATWGAEYVWRFYNDRSCLENIIKESQYDFGSNHVLSQAHGGNVTWLALSILAYNITNWFRERVLQQRAHRNTARTLRRLLIEIPGRLIHHAGQYEMVLWRDHPSRTLFERAVVALETLTV